MSTEHQQYSAENQREAIKRYAEAHDMQIVRTYADLGRSGLRIENRQGLQELLQDVESRRATYSAVLVYDVSRWGRFQDTDESAHYEYLCRRAGINIHYCAEQFENDGSIPSTVIKAIKRSMAAEYSRELGVKTFAGVCRVVKMGFNSGSMPGYGLRRRAVDKDGRPKQLLGPGEYKNCPTDHVILEPGPDEEVQVIREIFDLFTKKRESLTQIAAQLNARGIKNHHGKPWKHYEIKQIIISPKYAGVSSYNKSSRKFAATVTRHNPSDTWVWRENAFTPLVPIEQWHAAQGILAARVPYRYKEEQLLERLRQLLMREEKLSGKLIERSTDTPRPATYVKHFGDLAEAFRRVGYPSVGDYCNDSRGRKLRRVRRMHRNIVLKQLRDLGAQVKYDSYSRVITVNEDIKVVFLVATCHEEHRRGQLWRFTFRKWLRPDITIVARLRPGNREVLDYFLFPNIEPVPDLMRLYRHNNLLLESYQFHNLDFLFTLTKRSDLPEHLCHQKKQSDTSHQLELNFRSA